MLNTAAIMNERMQKNVVTRKNSRTMDEDEYEDD